jgi:PTH2 family peptidyl-tRNA hydrolase
LGFPLAFFNTNRFLFFGCFSVKQVIVLRTDLEMGKGKLVAQGSHASLQAFLEANETNPEGAEKWLRNGAGKICVKVKGEGELFEVFQKAKKLKLPCAIITDAGHTQIPPGTKTACAIGPCEDAKADEVTGKLKLL